MDNNSLEPNKIYVISDITDNKLCVVDISTGVEHTLYVLTGDENLDVYTSNDYGPYYNMDELSFMNLNLTDAVELKNGALTFYKENFEITNSDAWSLLVDLYDLENESEGQEYKVVDISDFKVFLTNADDSGGYFSIYRELYPDFKIGDIVKKVDKKYVAVIS